MSFFNIIATSGLGENNNLFQEIKNKLGDGKVSINANPFNGNLFVKDFCTTFTDAGFTFDIGMVYNSQAKPAWRLNQGKNIQNISGP